MRRLGCDESTGRIASAYRQEDKCNIMTDYGDNDVATDVL
jgi:hypothetical protein